MELEERENVWAAERARARTFRSQPLHVDVALPRLRLSVLHPTERQNMTVSSLKVAMQAWFALFMLAALLVASGVALDCPPQRCPTIAYWDNTGDCRGPATRMEYAVPIAREGDLRAPLWNECVPGVGNTSSKVSNNFGYMTIYKWENTVTCSHMPVEGRQFQIDQCQENGVGKSVAHVLNVDFGVALPREHVPSPVRLPPPEKCGVAGLPPCTATYQLLHFSNADCTGPLTGASQAPLIFDSCYFDPDTRTNIEIHCQRQTIWSSTFAGGCSEDLPLSTHSIFADPQRSNTNATVSHCISGKLYKCLSPK